MGGNRWRLTTAAGAGPPPWWRPLVWPPWSLALRPVTARDAGPVARALTDEIARWIGLETAEKMRGGTPAWAAGSEELAARRDTYRYLVEREGRLAGAIEIRRDPLRGHIGYWLRRPERGKGTATRALHCVLLIGFEGMGLRAVDLTADAENAPSIAVMERVGARRVGVYPSESVPSRTSEARYRLTRARHRPAPDGPRSLEALLAAG